MGRHFNGVLAESLGFVFKFPTYSVARRQGLRYVASSDWWSAKRIFYIFGCHTLVWSVNSELLRGLCGLQRTNCSQKQSILKLRLPASDARIAKGLVRQGILSRSNKGGDSRRVGSHSVGLSGQPEEVCNAYSLGAINFRTTKTTVNLQHTLDWAWAEG